MKNMSFGKILTIFVIVFVVAIGITFILINNANKSEKIASTNHYTLPPVQAFPSSVNNQIIKEEVSASASIETPVVPDKIIEKPATENETKSIINLSKEAEKNNSEEINDNSQKIIAINSNITDLNRRVSSLESRKKTPIKIRNMRTSNKPILKKVSQAKEEIIEEEIVKKNSTSDQSSYVSIPSSTGYKVQATVGKRAWIQSGDRTESVTVGDFLPTVEYKQLRIIKVDSDSGIVITTHDSTVSKDIKQKKD